MKGSRVWLWLLIPLVLGLWRLRFDVEVLHLLPGNSRVVRGLKLYQENFSDARQLILTVRAPEADAAEQAARALAVALRRATNLAAEVTWRPGWEEHPDQSAELVAYLWLNQPPEVFGALTNRLAPANLAATLREAREQLATSFSPADLARRGYDPYNLLQLPDAATGAAPAFGSGQEIFSSPDGTFRLVFVQAVSDLANYRECLAWLSGINAIIEETRARENIPATVVIRRTGRPAFVAEISSGMQRDITGSVASTFIVIVGLFWWAHRRWLPLAWLLTLLVLILGGTLALGGLIFGTLNVMSVGFAAILLGLAVDYGLVLYQEALAAPHATAAEIRRAVAPSIFWAAVTTAGAFALLNLSGLPGLAQLGSLVAIGVALAAVVMLYGYLPPLLRARGETLTAPHSAESAPSRPARVKTFLAVTAAVLVLAALMLGNGLPAMNHSADPLRPAHSEAHGALAEFKARMQTGREPSWVLVAGKNEGEVAARLARVETELKRATNEHLLSRFVLPTALWPQPERQAANRAAARQLVAGRDSLLRAALDGGFTTNALVVTDNMLRTWAAASAATNVFWPTNENSRWLFGKFLARPCGEFLAMGLVYPPTNGPSPISTRTPKSESRAERGSPEPQRVAGKGRPQQVGPPQPFQPAAGQETRAPAPRSLQDSISNLQLETPGVWLSGWDLLGPAVFAQVQQDFWRVFVPMGALLLVALWLAFRRVGEIVLSLLTLAFSGLCLLTMMKLCGWSWNLMNLMAAPLLLGAGVDYSIHMQLALRRHDGDLRAAHRAVGRALWLCGGTTVAGFGSNAWASNAGMASLGQVCAVGIASVMLTGIYLLPVWWLATVGRKPKV